MNLPNLITVFRILISPLFFIELVSYKQGEEYHRWAALVFLTLGILSDALDGFLARIMKCQTSLGKILDPLADKLLLLSGFLGLLWVAELPIHPPIWFTVAVVFRDLVVIIGLLTLILFTRKAEVKPNLLGKFTTFFQMATLLAVLAGASFSPALWNITGVLTILSGLSYLFRDLPKLAESA